MGTLATRTTICITTLNRPEYLERTFRYYRDTGFGGVLLIGDGSKGSMAAANRAAVTDFAGVLHIIHMDAAELSQPATMTAMAERVETDFAVYSGDDDYLIPEALDMCEHALDQHPGHVSASGQAVALNAHGARAIPTSTSPYELPTSFIPGSLLRLEAFLKRYAVGIFNLHRTESWKEMFRETHRMTDKTIGGELAPCFLSAALGRCLQVNQLYLVRQIHGERYDLTPGRDWILNEAFGQSSQILLSQLTETIIEQDKNNPLLTEEGREKEELVPGRVWTAYMRYLSHGYFDMPEYRRRPHINRHLSLEALVGGTESAADLFRPVLLNITENPADDAAKPTLLINWGNPYVMDETITPVLADLAKRFTVVLMLVDFNLSEDIRAKAEGWKTDGLVEDVLVAPIHGGTPDIHVYMGQLTPVLQWYDFDVLLSISAMQPYERYLTDHILPEKCLRLVLWPHPTNLFIYPELAKAVVHDGRCGKIDRAIVVRRLKLQPRAWQELLRPSLTSLRLILFIAIACTGSMFLKSRKVSEEALRGNVARKRTDQEAPAAQKSPDVAGNVVASDDEPVRAIIIDKESSALDKILFTVKHYYDARKEGAPDFVRYRLSSLYGRVRWHQRIWRQRKESIWFFFRNLLQIKGAGEARYYRRVLLILAGMDIRKVMAKYLYTCDRYILPLLQMGKAIPFRRLDVITQIGTDQFDACLFYNDADTEAHKVFFNNPNFYTVRYVPRPPADVGAPVNAVLLPFTIHAEKDMTPELVEIYCRDLGIALKESGADEIHIRPHPAHADSAWLHNLVADIAAGDVPCRLVGSENPLSDEAARYRGIIGAVSGSLRDARLACPDIFVVGSVALSETTFDMPKEVVGFPESIGWIERDGSYDPDIFKPKPQAMATFPTVPELIDRLMDGEFNARPTRLNK